MRIHIGKKIKEEVYRQNLVITVFAKKISRSRNVVYNIFERESVDTDLLHKIGKVLNCDFFSLYSTQKEYSHEGVKSFYVKEPESEYGKKHETLAQQNQTLKTEIAYLKKILSLVETKKGKTSVKKRAKSK